jgi:hypothetical protein
MIDVTELVGTVFSGLSALVIEDVEDAGRGDLRPCEDPGRGGGLPSVRHGELRARNVGLLDCARRLNLSLNTVKRYDRETAPIRRFSPPRSRSRPHRGLGA